MNYDLIKERVDRYKKNILLLAVVVSKKQAVENISNERVKELTIFSLEKHLDTLWKEMQQGLAQNNFNIKLENINAIVSEIKELKEEANPKEKNKYNKLLAEIRKISTQAFYVRKLSDLSNLPFGIEKLNLLNFFIKNDEFKKSIEIIMAENKNECRKNLEFIKVNNSKMFANILSLVQSVATEKGLSKSEIEEIKEKIISSYIKEEVVYIVSRTMVLDVTEESKKNIVNGFLSFNTTEVTELKYRDRETEKEKYYSSYLAYKNACSNLGEYLFDLESKADNKDPEVFEHTLNKIFKTIINDSNQLENFINTNGFVSSLENIKQFLYNIQEPIRGRNFMILKTLIEKLPSQFVKEAEKYFNSHQESYDINKIQIQRNKLVDNLKCLSEHLLNTVPARSKVKDSTPANIQYKLVP